MNRPQNEWLSRKGQLYGCHSYDRSYGDGWWWIKVKKWCLFSKIPPLNKLFNVTRNPKNLKIRYLFVSFTLSKIYIIESNPVGVWREMTAIIAGAQGSYTFAYLRALETEFRLSLFLFFNLFQLEFRDATCMNLTLKQYYEPWCLWFIFALIFNMLNISPKWAQKNIFSRDGIPSRLAFVFSTSKIWLMKSFLHQWTHEEWLQ